MKLSNSPKTRFCINKFLRISIIVVILIFLFFSLLIAKNICQKSSSHNGWSCGFMFSKTAKLFEGILERKCSIQKGEFSSGEMLVSKGFYASCLIPFTDAEKQCSNSEMCQGDCEYPGLTNKLPEGCKESLETSKSKDIFSDKKYLCSKNITGKCTKEKMNSCDIWNEVDNNVIIAHKNLCDF